MRQSERTDLRRIRVRIRAGDLTAALALIEALVDPPRREEQPSPQLPLPAIGDVFLCPRTACLLTVADCLVRRSRAWASGGPKGHAKHMECVTCGVGAENAARCPGFVPPPITNAPEVLPTSQRMARRARQLMGLEDGEPVDVGGMAEAAALTPDDRSDWRG